ncbi:MAG: GNAT family N-acetyltransferase [Aeromicrobium sp.]
MCAAAFPGEPFEGAYDVGAELTDLVCNLGEADRSGTEDIVSGSPGEANLQLEVWPTPEGDLTFPAFDQVDAERRVETLMSGVAPGSAVVIEDQDVRRGLLTRGAKEVRHLHTMRHLLRDVPDAEAALGVSLRSWEDGDAERLAAALVAAYGAEHPDARESDVGKAASALARTVDDPDNTLMSGATQVATFGGEPIGAALVQRSEHVARWSGPWLMNIFRAPAPAAPGIGAAMLARALDVLRADGEGHLGLAVTSSNPARGVYERLGFEYDSEMWVLVVGRGGLA